jgi:hypothetical protein
MYPTDWHSEYGQRTALSARKILGYMKQNFTIQSSAEIGCGDGHWTIEAQNIGIGETLGVDGPWTDRTTLKLSDLNFLEHDFSYPFDLKRKFDLAICLEVAEHVRGDAAEPFIDSLTSSSDLQLFGAAVPLQGGAGHINEQWQSWWLKKFTARDFIPFDLVRPVFWSDAEIHYWYRQNIIVYIRSCRSDLIAIARKLQLNAFNNCPIVDMVHPEKYITAASYESIQFKALFRKLPGKLFERVMRSIR